jgi:hypothetical protein
MSFYQHHQNSGSRTSFNYHGSNNHRSSLVPGYVPNVTSSASSVTNLSHTPQRHHYRTSYRTNNDSIQPTYQSEDPEKFNNKSAKLINPLHPHTFIQTNDRHTQISRRPSIFKKLFSMFNITNKRKTEGL